MISWVDAPDDVFFIATEATRFVLIWFNLNCLLMTNESLFLSHFLLDQQSCPKAIVDPSSVEKWRP